MKISSPLLYMHTLLLSTMTTSTTTASSTEVSNTCSSLTAILIGAGPSGLVTSLALSRHLAKVTLIEKHASFEPRGATFGIAPNGKRALQEISPELWQELQQVGVDLSNAGLSMNDGGLMLPWWEMRDAAVKVVRQRPNIELVMGETFTEIVDDGDGVKVRLASGKELQADVLIGADGISSSVRKWLGLSDAIETGNVVYRGHLTVRDDSSPELKALLDKGPVPIGARQLPGVYFIAFNFHTKYPGRLVWVLSTTNPIQSDDVTPLSLLQKAGINAEDERLFAEMFDLTDPENLKPFPASKVIDMSDIEQYNGRWGGRGLVTLVGDAAHAMRPTDGQGGNQAFEDAVVLARMIAKVEDKSQLAQALHDYEVARLPRVKTLHDDQRIRSEKRMRGEQVMPHTGEFRKWIHDGV